ncbi:MAG: hypothetical protein DSY55_00115 [Clostridia bacterium]|nr:MAG: hypothetical protein DSY55_00115 [Clostridia bacterium]
MRRLPKIRIGLGDNIPLRIKRLPVNREFGNLLSRHFIGSITCQSVPQLRIIIPCLEGIRDYAAKVKLVK